MRLGQIILLRQKIVDGHGRWLAAARNAATLCLQATAGSASPDERIQKLVAYPELAKQLGAPPAGLELYKNPLHPYQIWLQNLWGRRCSYFISNLADGLEQAVRLQPDETALTKLVAEFGEFHKSLSIRFERTIQLGFTPEKSLIERGDLANFHVTYLDPVLFSALYHLRRSKRKGHTMTPQAAKILWNHIKVQVEISTDKGNGKDENIMDVSTVWWGFVELVKLEQSGFNLGEYSGWRGVVGVCRNLIHSNSGAVRWPHPEEAIYEATPEIYGLLRTRILVAMNCVNLAAILPPRPLALIAEELNTFAAEQFDDILNRSEEVESHICWLGLALQLTSSSLSTAAQWENREPYRSCVVTASQLCDADRVGSGNQKYFIVTKSRSEFKPRPEGDQPLTIVEKLRLQKEDFDIFVDLNQVWVKSEGQQSGRVQLKEKSRLLLMALLRYGPVEMDSDDLYGKIDGSGGASNSQTARSNLASEVTRLRNKLSPLLPDSMFCVPKKVRGKVDRGYSCAGNYSCCMILPNEAQAALQVKTFSRAEF